MNIDHVPNGSWFVVTKNDILRLAMDAFISKTPYINQQGYYYVSRSNGVANITKHLDMGEESKLGPGKVYKLFKKDLDLF